MNARMSFLSWFGSSVGLSLLLTSWRRAVTVASTSLIAGRARRSCCRSEVGTPLGRLVVSQRWTSPPPSIGPGQLDDDRQDVEVREEVHGRASSRTPSSAGNPRNPFTCGVSAAMMLGKSTCWPVSGVIRSGRIA